MLYGERVDGRDPFAMSCFGVLRGGLKRQHAFLGRAQGAQAGFVGGAFLLSTQPPLGEFLPDGLHIVLKALWLLRRRLEVIVRGGSLSNFLVWSVGLFKVEHRCERAE